MIGESNLNGVNLGIPYSKGITRNFVGADAKLGNVLGSVRKHVVVSGYPPYIEVFTTFCNGSQIGPENIERCRLDNAFWRDQRQDGIALNEKLKVVRQSGVKKFISYNDIQRPSSARLNWPFHTAAEII